MPKPTSETLPPFFSSSVIAASACLLYTSPFCGSGTLVIEAAQKALNIAPGLRRRFAAEHFDFVPADIWAEQRKKALSEVRKDAAFELSLIHI